MARKKVKTSEARSFRIRKDICERMDTYSDKSMIPRTAIVELALIDFLNKVDPVEELPKNSKPVGFGAMLTQDTVAVQGSPPSQPASSVRALFTNDVK